MKDVLFLHDNARPHTSLRIREATGKMGRTVLPHPADTPDVTPSDYDLFGTVKNAVSGLHFADDNRLKQSFLTGPEVKTGYSMARAYSV
jgi:histone-lysine N-methyltransferase SETMAR